MEYMKDAGLIVILLIVSLEDLRTYEIPDRCHVAAVFWWGIFLLMERNTRLEVLMDGLAGGIVVAGGLLFISMVMDRILGRESLGGGDIKLFFVTGLYLGLARNLLNLILSCVIGIIVGLGLKGKPEDGSESPAIPFAPAIAISTCICILAGNDIVNWYLSLLG